MDKIYNEWYFFNKYHSLKKMYMYITICLLIFCGCSKNDIVQIYYTINNIDTLDVNDVFISNKRFNDNIMFFNGELYSVSNRSDSLVCKYNIDGNLVDLIEKGVGDNKLDNVMFYPIVDFDINSVVFRNLNSGVFVSMDSVYKDYTEVYFYKKYNMLISMVYNENEYYSVIPDMFLDISDVQNDILFIKHSYNYDYEIIESKSKKIGDSYITDIQKDPILNTEEYEIDYFNKSIVSINYFYDYMSIYNNTDVEVYEFVSNYNYNFKMKSIAVSKNRYFILGNIDDSQYILEIHKNSLNSDVHFIRGDIKYDSITYGNDVLYLMSYKNTNIYKYVIK